MKFVGWLLLVFMLLSSAQALVVYNSDQVVSGVGGTTYWASKTSVGNGTTTTTRVSSKQGSPGSNFYRPGQTTSESVVTKTENAQGYGWATDFDLDADIDAGTWYFKISSANSRGNNGNGVIGVNVFKYCSGTTSFLFYIEGTTNVLASSSQIDQTLTTDQPGISAAGCRIKFEYWLITTSVNEDQRNSLRGIDTSAFSVDFPASGGSPQTCADVDSDSYQDVACGGTDCNDNDANIHPGATETCNNKDDNCNTQTDEGLTQATSCGVGACLVNVTQTCTSGQYSPVCTPKSPVAEICSNGIDEDCNGVADNGCTCTPGATQACGVAIGICTQGVQTCSNAGVWGSCTGGVQPTTELCNGLDDNCNNQTDENISVTTTCGLGACNVTITQSCNNGVLLPACVPKEPKIETCNNKDDNCNGEVDESIEELCGINIGQCRPGKRMCSNGKFGECIGANASSNEVCDGLDNNCDGKVDEGSVCFVTAVRPCLENWTCTTWSDCLHTNTSFRNCTDTNMCNTTAKKPLQEKSCYLLNDTSATLTSTDTKNIDSQAFVIVVIGVCLLGVLLAWIFSKRAEKKL